VEDVLEEEEAAYNAHAPTEEEETRRRT